MAPERIGENAVMTDILSLIGGLVLLVMAGDALVRGAVSASVRFGVPPFIVSLVIVGFGTSAPELLISVQSVLTGAPGLALGNVVGSNIANVALVLGLSVAISAIPAKAVDTRKSYIQMLLATLIFIALCFAGPLTWWHGLILLACLAYMLTSALRAARAHRRADPDRERIRQMPDWQTGAFLIAGLVGLPLGADFLVDGARGLAHEFGVSDEIIGLTIVAIGTSLPELFTSAIAAMKKHAEVALGNVLGSNLFNLLAIMGVTTLIGEVPVNRHLLVEDLWVMLAATLALLPFTLQGRAMPRGVGFGFLIAYGAYMVTLF